MTEIVSRGQALEFGSRALSQVSWDAIDGSQFQREVINLPPAEFNRRLTAFLKNGMRFNFGDLCVATAPFDVKTFCGDKWQLLEDEQDNRSAALSEVNFKTADFLANLEGEEKVIGGEEKLKRLRKTGRILYGANVFAGVWANYLVNKENRANSFLEKLYQERGITRMYFFGDVLLGPNGYRCVLCVCRDDDGSWDWYDRWLGNDFDADRVAAVSASLQV